MIPSVDEGRERQARGEGMRRAIEAGVRTIDHGDGGYVWDLEGNRYLDFFGGVLTTMIGHNHPAVTAAMSMAPIASSTSLCRIMSTEFQ